jgi:hypothetical protein
LVEIDLTTSRRALLGSLSATSLVAVPGIASRWERAVAALPCKPAVVLQRSREGRSNSRFRYHNAEAFFAGVPRGFECHGSDQHYRIGIVIQLALSSHLLDVGFDGKWCARHFGLDLDKALAHANATGLGHDCRDFARLAVFLSPYGKFRNPGFRTPRDCPYSGAEVCQLVRALLDRIHEVTGHRRPRGWSGLLS